MGYAFGKPYKSVRKLEEPISYLISSPLFAAWPLTSVAMHAKEECINLTENVFNPKYINASRVYHGNDSFTKSLGLFVHLSQK